MSSRYQDDQNHRPQVAHVIDSLSISGGAERQLVANLRSFDHDLMSHHVILLRQAEQTRLSEIPSRVRVWDLAGRDTSLTRTQAARRLVSLVRREGFDVVHASLPDSALAARITGFLTPAAVVESLVNISHEAIRTVDNPNVSPAKLRMHAWLDKITMRGVDRFHAVSQAVADSWAAVVGIDPERTTVIPRGIDSQALAEGIDRARARAEIVAELGLPADAFIVLAVGRVEPQKGHRYLIEATSRIRDDMPGLRVMIVGRSGIASPAVTAQIERESLKDIVTLTGARNDIPRLLAAADVFAFPSLFEGNGGNAMIEAMAMGLAIVTTDSPPMTDLIPSAEFGRLVPRLDSGALAEAILELKADDELRARLGAAARERAGGFATPGEISGRYEKWYGELLGERGVS